jgi:hypothetical protein
MFARQVFRPAAAIKGVSHISSCLYPPRSCHELVIMHWSYAYSSTYSMFEPTRLQAHPKAEARSGDTSDSQALLSLAFMLTTT